MDNDQATMGAGGDTTSGAVAATGTTAGDDTSTRTGSASGTTGTEAGTTADGRAAIHHASMQQICQMIE